MAELTDDRLIAYLDGELSEDERAEIAAALAGDAELRERATSLTESAALLRAAFADIVREPVPERLIAAARGAAINRDAGHRHDARPPELARLIEWAKRQMGDRRWWIGVTAAASIAGLLVGTGLGFFAADESGVAGLQPARSELASGGWLDSIAGYHKLFVNAGPNDIALADVPPNGVDARKVTQKLPPDFRLPNLKPWGLVFQGARFLIVEGRPATQLFYTTTNKALGPITVVVGTSNKPDLAPTFDRRDDLNLLYWRHHGHSYALVGTADIGYLWNIANDIAWQLDAI